MSHLVILRIVSKFLIPFIFLFALYVQWHGDFGPGGGFQAGVIFSSGFILYALIFGVSLTRQAAPAWLTRAALAIGVLLYSGVGVAGMVMGGNFLSYSVLADEPTGNLDSANGERVLELLRDLSRQQNLTVLMATHSREAAEYAGRTVVLMDGRGSNQQ